MICSRCSKRVYIQSVTESQCKICGKNMITPHKPAYSICEACSKKNHRCRQCGCVID